MRVASFVLVACTLALAAKPASDLSVTTNIADYDASNNTYILQSDGSGPYQNGVSGVVSILVANGYNHITWGDWRVDLRSSARNAALSFCDGNACPLNAVQPGDPGYTVPANPPYWGTQIQPVRMENKCSQIGLDMHAMKAGDKFNCPTLLRLPDIARATFYRLEMLGDTSEPETQKVQVSCNAADSSGCNDWFIDPIPVVNSDGSVSPGRTRARLNLITTSGSGAGTINEGDFYLTSHIHVTRP